MLKNLLKENPIVLSFISLILFLILCELGLRFSGAKPGVFVVGGDFKVVDTPRVLNNFTTDEVGIYKFSNWVCDSLFSLFNAENSIFSFKILNKKIGDIDKLDLIYHDYTNIINPNYRPPLFLCLKSKGYENSIESDLQKKYYLIVKKNNKTPWEESIVNYMNHPFNEEGFRSINYNSADSTRKRILIVGDSYVFGMNARPIHASFVDNLLAKGYLVFSAGIPGTDPAQYAAIARKYIPKIKPDLVIMCFYEGNDYMPFDRDPHPNQPHEYISNAGFFQSAPLGKFMDFKACYAYYKSLVVIPDTDRNFFNRQMSKTVICSLVWGICYKLKIVEHPIVAETEEKTRIMNENQNPNFTARHIQAFETECRKNKVKSIFTLIPQRDDVTHEDNEFVTPNLTKANTVFQGISYVVPKGLKRKIHYGDKDNHFNTAGHLHFAAFLDSLITTNLIINNDSINPID